MTPSRQQMMAARPLSGKGERTQPSDLREVRLLAQFYGQSPDVLSEQELQADFLHRKNVDGRAPASMRLGYSAIRFFYPHVRQRDGQTRSLIRAPTEHRLPAVLSGQKVRRLLKAATPRPHQVYFTTVSSLGLRLHDALYLQPADIDSQRLQVHAHRGKGAKDRCGPRPQDTLALLRAYWKTHRHQTGPFPTTGRDQKQSPTATSPMSRASVQGAFRKATPRARITNTGMAIHPLRQSYATHLLEAGLNLQLLPRSLGHSRLDTPRLYLPLTQKGHEDADERSKAVRRGLTS